MYMLKYLKNKVLNHFTVTPKAIPLLSQDELAKWFLLDPNGRNLLSHERNYLIKIVSDIYGNYSLQLAMPEINFLQGNQIVNHYVINHDVMSDLRFMAIESNSVDLIVCPHILEFESNYHHILQELYRILRADGKIIFICFNQHSLFSMMRHKNSVLKQLNFIDLPELKYQLTALNFVIDGGKFINYLPVCKKARRIHQLTWLDKVGDRWFPTLSNVFVVVAHKEVVSFTAKYCKNSKQEEYIPVSVGVATACRND